MKCLMIKPEYVIEILEGTKTIEYRTWPTKHRGDFFVGASSTRHMKGFLAAVASINTCIYNSQERCYEWYLDNIRPIRPIPIKGQLRLFETGIEDYEVLHTDEEIEKAFEEAQPILMKGK